MKGPICLYHGLGSIPYTWQHVWVECVIGSVLYTIGFPGSPPFLPCENIDAKNSSFNWKMVNKELVLIGNTTAE